MSFTSNVQLWAVSIFSPSRSLGVTAPSESETSDKYKPWAPTDLGVIRKAQCAGFRLCLRPRGVIKITSYNLFWDLQTACVNMPQYSKGRSACLCLLGLVICSVLHSQLAGEGSLVRTESVQNIITALKRQGVKDKRDNITFGMKDWYSCLWNDLAEMWPDGGMCVTQLIYKGVQAEWHGLPCQAELRSESIEMEQSPWSVRRRSSVTRCLLHCGAFKRYWNLWKLWPFRCF